MRQSRLVFFGFAVSHMCSACFVLEFVRLIALFLGRKVKKFIIAEKNFKGYGLTDVLTDTPTKQGAEPRTM